MFDNENDNNEEEIMYNILEGVPVRDTVIGRDEIIDLQIALGVTKDVADFIDLI